MQLVVPETTSPGDTASHKLSESDGKLSQHDTSQISTGFGMQIDGLQESNIISLFKRPSHHRKIETKIITIIIAHWRSAFKRIGKLTENHEDP